MTEQEIVDEALATRLAPVAEQVCRAVLPSVRLVRAGPDDLSKGTRIGGEPDLPQGVKWPEWQGRPLAFLAQIELSGLPNIEPGRELLPRDGTLAFFFDADLERQPWGFDPNDAGSSRVIYVPPNAAVDRVELPAELPSENLYAPGDLVARRELTLPEPETPASPKLPLGSDLREAYLDVLEALTDAHGDDSAPRHRLLGHPDQVQGDMQTECQLVSHGLYTGDSSGWEEPRADELRPGAAGWKLLLQLDSEFTPREVMWGDAGRIYSWLKESDLRARRFDSGWTILQCG